MDEVEVEPLRGLLSLLPGDDSAKEREQASLSLVVNLRTLKPQDVRQALQSLRRMESYSQSLQRYPLVKQAFWEQVLASKLVVGAGRRRQELKLRDERFPRLVLDVSRAKLTPELLRELAEFFAASADDQTVKQSPFSGVKRQAKKLQTMRFVPVVLRCIRCRLTAETIKMLQSVLLPRGGDLDHKTSKVSYCVTTLDLSENSMNAEELMALAGLLRECSWRRVDDPAPTLEELVLEKVVGRFLTTENWAAFRVLVKAAFGITPSVNTPLGRRKTPLRRLSLANSSFTYHHVACVCSALRSEDSSLEELSLAHCFSVVDPADRETCWQWLAIGLRAMAPHSAMRRLDLSGNPLYPRDSEVWRECLGNPTSAIQRWSGDDVTSAIPFIRATAPCCSLSSNVEFYKCPSPDSPRLRIIEKEVAAAPSKVQWEVLGSTQGEPEWICVIVPAFGVAWTQAKFVAFPVSSPSVQAHSFAVLSDLVINSMTAAITTAEALEIFAGGFGGQLQSLEMRHNTLDARDLNLIVAGLEQLHHLDVEGCRLLNLQLLVDALVGNRGQQLRTLNLNGNLVGAEAASVLTTSLRGNIRGRVPVLRELRLAHNEIGASGVQHVYSLLEVNKNLQLVELDFPTEEVAPTRDDFVQLYQTRCMRLDVAFQNELLGTTPLALTRKITFLLILNACDVVMDRGICSIVFDFAAEEQRRCILWNSACRRD